MALRDDRLRYGSVEGGIGGWEGWVRGSSCCYIDENYAESCGVVSI